MSVRSEWRLSELLFPDDDPFDMVILTSGLQVDLAGSGEVLLAGLREALDFEARLFNRGVTCDLKDNGQDCLDCAMYVADRAEEPRAPLCRLGRDQRLIEERYQAARRAPLIELATGAEELTEIGHTEEYADLLTAAGL